MVIFAIGQKTNVSFLSEEDGIQLTERGLIQVDPETLAASRLGVFAGGDAVLGPASFVQAVAQGRQAAEAIHSYLQYGHLRIVEPKEKPVDPEVTQEERDRAKPIERQQMPVLAPARSARPRIAKWNSALAPKWPSRKGSAAWNAACAANVASASGSAALEPSSCTTGTHPGTGSRGHHRGHWHHYLRPRRYPEYGFGKYPDVVTNLQFERLCNASGPTGGRPCSRATVRCLKSIAFIQCVGSRDPSRGMSIAPRCAA